MKDISIPEEVKRLLKSRLIIHESLPSTNEYCKKDLVRDGQIVLAQKQTSGHGRMGRSFVSKEGGIYVSFCFEPRIGAKKLIPVTGMCAVAVRRAIKRCCDVSPEIKWTNDILLCGKKICGILAETTFEGGRPKKLIIGIGINLNQSKESFEGELSETASSISALTCKNTDPELMSAVLMEEIDRAYKALCEGGNAILPYIEEYRVHCSTLGKEIHILHPSLAPEGTDPRKAFAEDPSIFPSATAVDIDESFGLIVRYADGKRETLFSGEISIR